MKNRFELFYIDVVKDPHPTSRKDAIKANCLQCVGFENVVANIAGCTCKKTCPLYPFRPYKRADADPEDSDSAD